jgi:hypothetical protein
MSEQRKLLGAAVFISLRSIGILNPKQIKLAEKFLFKGIIHLK